MENTNAVPESTAANNPFSTPSLDADQVSSATLDQIDQMLDAAEASVSHVAPATRMDQQTLDSLNRITEASPIPDPNLQVQAQPAPTPEPPTPEPIPEPTPEPAPLEIDPSIDPDIAAIQPPQNISEVNQNNWKALQQKASEYKQQAEQAEVLRQQLEQLKNESQSKVIPEDYEELKQFRAVFDTQNDPNFKSKYDSPISTATESIYSILRKNGAPDEVINSIEEAGGPDKVNQNWWKTQALDRLPFTDAEKIKQNLVAMSDLKEGREKEINEMAAKRPEYLERQKTELVDKFYNTHQEMEQYASEIAKDIPWASFRKIEDSMSQQEKVEAAKHNNAVSVLQERFTAALYPTTPKTRAEVAAAAVASHVLSEQLRLEQASKAQIQAELQRLTNENNALKNAGRIPKSNPTPQNTSRPYNQGDRIKMNASDAIDMGLDEALGM